MDNSKDELQTFKREINLVDFAIQIGGYSYKKGYQNKSNENTTIVLVKNEKQPDEENLLFRKNPSNDEYVYFNPENSFDKGSIIDFCSNKLQINLGEIRKVCRSFMHAPAVHAKKTELAPSHPLKQTTVDEKYFDVKPLTDTTYLRSRGLQDYVINSPLFTTTLGLKTIEYTDAKGAKHRFNNTAFLIKDLEGKTIGLAIKNSTQTGSYTANLKESSTLGMWVSNTPTKTANLTFGVVEHPIDALSHYQLNYSPLENGKEIIYFASNGTLRESHIEFVQHYIDQLKPTQVLLLNDNDNAGLRFNISYLGNLKSPGEVQDKTRLYANEDVKIDCHFAKPVNVLDIEIYNTKNLNNKDILNNITDYFHKFNHILYKKYNNKKDEFEIKSIVQTDVKTEVKIIFDNRKELLLDGIELTQALRPNPLLQVQLPQDKDYNQDLQNILKKEIATTQSLGK